MRITTGRQQAFLLVALGCVLFVVLVALAMFHYPGGTFVDSTTEGYSLFDNFLGDLGRRPLSLSGHPNRISPLLFALALIIGGSALTLFYIVFPGLFSAGGSDYILEWVGSMAGVAAGVCLIGVALTPVNRYWVTHNQLATWACEAFTVACVSYMVVALRAPHYPRQYALAFLLFVVAVAGYLAIYLFGPQLNTSYGPTTQAITQKLIVLAAVATIAFESWGAYRAAANRYVPSGESEGRTPSSAPCT